MTEPNETAEPSGASRGYLARLAKWMMFRSRPLTNPFELATTHPLKRQFVFKAVSVAEVAENPDAPRLHDRLDGEYECYSLTIMPFFDDEWLVTAWYR